MKVVPLLVFVVMAVVMVAGSIGGVLWMQRHYHYACWSWWCQR
jgi:hypothetical protein